MNLDAYIGGLFDENEKPLDNLVADGGFASIFRTLGCVGDSLSSGEFEAFNEAGKKVYLDFFDYSWGQFLARMAGVKVYNFSKGGMTAQEYMETFSISQNLWDRAKACQGYILALGVNDVLNKGQAVGTLADVRDGDWRQNAPTFAGYYAMIIQRLKEIQPDAKFFLMTIPPRVVRADPQDALRAAHAALLYDFAAHFSNTYVLDLAKYAPAYQSEAFRNFYMGGHMTPCGYVLTARIVASYLDYIIRHNIRDFDELAYIGTPNHYIAPAASAE